MDTYKIRTECTNCGNCETLRILKGQTTGNYLASYRCATCGCTTVVAVVEQVEMRE